MDQPTEPHPPATVKHTDLVTVADFARNLPPATVADDPGAYPEACGEGP